MRLLSLCLLLVGCDADLFTNNPPVLLSFNGYDFTRRQQYLYPPPESLHFEQGETLELSAEIRDPEHQDVRIWWPWAPQGWEFDPDGTTGVWQVPEDYNDWPRAMMILEDTNRRNPRASSYWIPLWTDDTGYYYR